MTRPRWWSRFEAKVQRVPGGCWLWTASVRSEGYGQFAMPGTRDVVRAHRLAYLVLVGPIPDGMVVDHLCRVTLCVNPKHLDAVTQRENVMRGRSHVAVLARQTVCQHGHPFTPENTYNRPDIPGRRACLTCKRAARARWALRA